MATPVSLALVASMGTYYGMRSLILCLLALLTVPAFGQDEFDKHGKTDAQILQMGMDKWTDFYTSKESTSTASMTAAAEIYGEAAKKRNDRLLKAMQNRQRAGTLQKLRKLMTDFSSSSVDIGYAESGGGTMFNTMWAAVTGVAEDALYTIIANKGSRPKAMVVSMVRKELAIVHKDIEDMHADKSNDEFFKYGDAKKALARMNSDFDAMVAIAKHMSRLDSDRVLAFCLQEAKNADIDSSK